MHCYKVCLLKINLYDSTISVELQRLIIRSTLALAFHNKQGSEDEQ